MGGRFLAQLANRVNAGVLGGIIRLAYYKVQLCHAAMPYCVHVCAGGIRKSSREAQNRLA